VLGISKDIINKAIEAGADEAEVFIERSRSSQIEILNQQIEAVDIKEETGFGLRVIKNKRLGFSFTTDPSAFFDLAKRAAASSDFSQPDSANALVKPKAQSIAMDIFDPAISMVPVEQKIAMALEIEKAAFNFDKRVKKTEKNIYFDGEAEIWIANSAGLEVSYKTNSCGGFIEIIAENGTGMENGAYSKYVKAFNKFDPKEIGARAAKRAVELLGAKSIPSQKLDLVMDPTVAENFLDALFALFSADYVQKNKSALKGKIGETIGSAALTIIDDGTLKGGLACSPFDSEGTPTQETILLKDGVLKNFLYDNYTAKKENKTSSGNGLRAGFKGVPTVAPTNLYIKPGITAAEDLIKSVSRGLYITRVMGMHTINPISGDFSVGASGIMIDGGKRTFSVRGITIAGNLIDLLKCVKAVGSDLEVTASTISPTLLIEGISVSGE
jgi:PmbA protein